MKTKGSLKEVKWSVYAQDMRARFSEGEFIDPMSELVSLKQANTVEEYYEEFEALLNLLNLSDEYSLSIFISNLKQDISRSVRLFQPKTLTHALNLAKQMELLIYDLPRKTFTPYKSTVNQPPSYSSNTLQPKSQVSIKPHQLPGILPTPKPSFTSYSNYTKPVYSTNQKSTYTKPESVSSKPIRSPTFEEREERRKKGLCMWCSQKFTRGHTCLRSQLYQLLTEDPDDGMGGLEDIVDCRDKLTGEMQKEGDEDSSPVISLHALMGTEGCQTMRVMGRIKKQNLVVLIDSGSTHNFLDQTVVKRLKCTTKSIVGVKVTVANGDALKAHELCELVQWESQGLVQFTDFMVLPLQGCDVVLGIQWLRTLGPIIWDFSALSMQFDYQGQKITLRGLQSGVIHYASKKQLSRMSVSAYKGTGTLLFAREPSLYAIELSPKQEWDDLAFMELQELLQQYADLFEEPRGLPPKRSHDHHIPLKDETQVVKIRPYRYPMVQKNEIKTIVAEMKATGIIRDSTSPFASPVVLVKKKDGSWRLCIDYRQLNTMTVKDKFPIPLVEELLDELAGACWFTKLDLRSGYHQIRMQERDIYKTAFRTHQGHYEFLVMPFGLTNAPSTFQALINHIFQPYLRHFVLVFFDDILIYSTTWAAHLQHLRQVFGILLQHQLFLKYSKCEIGASQVEYLGHVINGQGVAMDSKKITCMLEWPIPKNIKELRGFLGLTGYYRRFVKGYGVLARPLTDLLKKGNYTWFDPAQQAFTALKQAMVTAPVLAMPNFNTLFVVESDASKEGIGAVLSQGGRPIAYFSKGLSPKHQVLSVYEKEMMAILAAVKKWNTYLMGRHF